MKKNCFVIAESKSAALELAAGAASFAENVTMICLGAPVSAAGVSAVYAVADASASVASYTGAIAALVKEAAPEVVLVEQNRNGRLVAGVVAAVLGTGVQTDIFEIADTDAGIVTKRLSNGGLAVLTEEGKANAVVCIGAGIFAAAEEAAAADVKTIEAACAGITLVEKKEKVVQRTNLAAARRVVGVGRGVKDEATLAVMEGFAQAIGAEIGCTRPLAEEEHLLPTARYIGVSGVTIRPELYVAIGLSGQVQHTAGVDQSDFIFAINKDENAPIFKNCDLGIVGDLNTVVPKLMEALGK